jgi:peptidoglycan/LPS O-acetylase OafA/YrhL
LKPSLTNKLSHRIPTLDGLRGLAIILVVLYHYFPQWIVFNFGWSGVDLFFVLSGYLISSRLIPYVNDPGLLKKFYRNRILRIVPLYFIFLIIFLITWFCFSSATTLSAFPFYSLNWSYFFVFLQNWIFITDYTETKVHLQHLWSIAVEEQIYIVFPLFVLFLKSKKKILTACLLLLCVAVISRCIYSFYLPAAGGYDKAYWNTFFRTDPFLLGTVLYLLFNMRFSPVLISRYLNIAGIVCALILLCRVIITSDAEKNNLFMSSIGFTLVAILYAAVTWSQLQAGKNFMKRITGLPWLQFAGKISFGLYIIHWPLYLSGFIILNKMRNNFGLLVTDGQLQLINAFCCIPISFCLSALSFRFVESRFLKMKAKFS